MTTCEGDVDRNAPRRGQILAHVTLVFRLIHPSQAPKIIMDPGEVRDRSIKGQVRPFLVKVADHLIIRAGLAIMNKQPLAIAVEILRLLTQEPNVSTIGAVNR